MEDNDLRPKARGGKCDHPRCTGGPCKMWREEDIVITATDEELAKTLIVEGWFGVSSKYRIILRWKTSPPLPEEILVKEHQDTYWGKLVMDLYREQVLSDWYLRSAPKEYVEERELTFPQYRAFKKLVNGGWSPEKDKSPENES